MNSSTDNGQSTEVNPTDGSQSDRLSKVKSIMGAFVEKTVDTSRVVASKAKEKYQDPETRKSIKEFGVKVFDGTKDVGFKVVEGTKGVAGTVKQGVREKGYLEYLKELGARALDTTLDVGTLFYDKASSTAVKVKSETDHKGLKNYTKELAGKGADTFRRSYTETVDYIKKKRGSQSEPSVSHSFSADVDLSPNPVRTQEASEHLDEPQSNEQNDPRAGDQHRNETPKSDAEVSAAENNTNNLA